MKNVMKAPITMLLAGGTLVTLIVGTNSLPGAKAAMPSNDSIREVELAINDEASAAPAALATTPAPLTSTFAALLAVPMGPTTNTAAVKAMVPSAAATTKPEGSKG